MVQKLHYFLNARYINIFMGLTCVRYFLLNTAFGIQKGSDLKGVLDYNLRLLSEQGHIAKILKKYVPETWHKMGVEKPERGTIVKRE